MIALLTKVHAGLTRELGEIAGRERLHNGGIMYRVRFPDGRVRLFAGAYVSVAVEHAPIARLPFRPRLVVNNGELVS
jgi:hypothetical protein